MPYYMKASYYADRTRILLQDLIPPYRYSDVDIYDAINLIMSEVRRIRPDMFLDLKYQSRLREGDINDGAPEGYDAINDIDTLVPIPDRYINPVLWGISGWLQLYDVTDTQDQRAQAFLMKFNQHLMAVSAA